MDRVKRLRRKLDRLDLKLVDDLADRMRLTGRVARIKRETGEPLRDPDREAAVLRRAAARASRRGLPPSVVQHLMQEILRESRKLQEQAWLGSESRIRVVYQGVAGAYSEQAARRHFAGTLSLTACRTFPEVLETVRSGRADRGILPVENTITGSIRESLELLQSGGLWIVGEEAVRVDHALIAPAGARLEGIRRVHSHPQALAQCSRFLAEGGYVVESDFDTAGAARKLIEGKKRDLTRAAIASARGVRDKRLVVLARDIANSPDNLTRFWILAAAPKEVPAGVPARTSLFLRTLHREGALAQALAILARHRVNLTKLESHPCPETPWEYRFLLEFEGNQADPGISEALREFAGECRHVIVLGSYPLRVESPRPTTMEAAPLLFAEPKALPQPPREQDSGKFARVGRGSRARDTEVDVGGIKIRRGGFIVIAGPCAVESRPQIQRAAREVARLGARILRGGTFKPRTSPDSFQGLGWKGVELLAEAGRRNHLPVVTEVLAPEQVARMAGTVALLQVGARNMQNFPLLVELGRQPKPVLLKRGMMATLDELCYAAEHIMKQGNQQIILCERGIRTFETATRNTLDLSAVPILHQRTHLPVVVDPSHAAGDVRWVLPLAKAAKAVGAEGILVEVHPEPAKALSDGVQSLDPDGFARLMQALGEVAGKLPQD